MKRFIIFATALLLADFAMAQDLLVKRNGEQMRVKVLKITKKKVQFVRHGTELPIYTLPIKDIDYIEYPLGDRDTFGRGKSEVTVAENSNSNQTQDVVGDKWHGPVPPPPGGASLQVTPQEPAAYRYSVGDIYEKDGIKGIVIVLYDGGLHGLVMSLDEACLPWCTLHRKQLKKMGANSNTDGMVNMHAIEKFIADNNLSWDDFPAFKWCREKGTGWYLPSINELWSAGTMYMGGSRIASSRKPRKAFNQSLEAAGGKPLSNIMTYHSSTEDKDARYSLFSHMNSEPPYINSGYKADDLFVRAFYKF